MDDGLNFMNTEVENLRCKVESIERETKFLKERLPYQEVYNRRENLRFMERELSFQMSIGKEGTY